MDPRIKAITDQLFFIQRGWLNCNHLVFTGSPKTLIDTAYVGNLEDTEALINECGLAIEDVELIINTHSHCDHIGGNAAFQARSGCKVAMHEIDRYHLEQGNRMATWWDYYQQDADVFPVHQGLSDGDVLRLGEMNLLVLHTPGHAMGQIALYFMDTGWLVSGDSVWQNDFGVLTTRIEGLDAPFRLRESLVRLSRLNVTSIFPGHGPMLADGKAAIEACLQRVEAFIEQPSRMGRDQVRKIMLYTLQLRGPLEAGDFQRRLAASPWFPEVCDLYFEGDQEKVFQEAVEYFQEKGLARLEDGVLTCLLEA